MTDLQTRSLGDLVAENQALARMFDRLGLDYCCHGERSLAAACAELGLDPATVADQLASMEAAGDGGWAQLEPPALADSIVEAHHRYLREELPLLEALAEKVLGVHGERHPELTEVRALVHALRAELGPHLAKEEKILFPAIHELAGGRHVFPFGSVAGPIAMMLGEHDQAGELLAALRAATGGYDVPADGCASYRSLYERLEALEADTHVHVHKENHTLFPAVLRMVDPG